MAKVIFRGKRRDSNVNIYLLNLTPEELAEYKAAKGSFYMEDDVSGKPLYFAQRMLSSTVDYKIDDQGSLMEPESATMQRQAAVDKLAQYNGLSTNELQQLALLKQAGLL